MASGCISNLQYGIFMLSLLKHINDFESDGLVFFIYILHDILGNMNISTFNWF